MPRLDAKWLNFTARGQTWDHFWQDAASAAVETETPPARRNDSDGPGFEDDDMELIVVALRRRLRV